MKRPRRAGFFPGCSPSFPWTPEHHRPAAARQGDPARTEARTALAELCRAYWYPLYAFIRRRGHDPEAAQDLTQEFFARLLEADFLAGVDRSKGKFRAFLLAACTHFLANQRDFLRAQKRGGGQRILDNCFIRHLFAILVLEDEMLALQGLIQHLL